jgi:hypothetical protein
MLYDEDAQHCIWQVTNVPTVLFFQKIPWMVSFEYPPDFLIKTKWKFCKGCGKGKAHLTDQNHQEQGANKKPLM